MIKHNAEINIMLASINFIALCIAVFICMFLTNDNKEIRAKLIESNAKVEELEKEVNFCSDMYSKMMLEKWYENAY